MATSGNPLSTSHPSPVTLGRKRQARTQSAGRIVALASRYRVVLLGLAGIRIVLGVAAVALVPLWYEQHFVWVVLLRPTKEILLAAGFLVRRGDVALPPVLLAAVPLVMLAVWLMYALGVLYRRELRDADLPWVAGRLLPPDRIERLAGALERAGEKAVFLGRLAIFPSSLMAAAAGASEVPPRRFLVADGLGAIVSVAEVVGAGYLLGETYERAGPWLTAAGAAALVGLLLAVGRVLHRNG